MLFKQSLRYFKLRGASAPVPSPPPPTTPLPVGAFHNTVDLRRDYVYNATSAHKFWLCWMKGYPLTLQGRSKWWVTRENLSVGQLVVVGDAHDFSKRGVYRLGRVNRIHPQKHKGR